jgi:hypothetical protein
LSGDADRNCHYQRQRDQGFAAAEHHTLLWAARGHDRQAARSFVDKNQGNHPCCGAQVMMISG